MSETEPRFKGPAIAAVRVLYEFWRKKVLDIFI